MLEGAVQSLEHTNCLASGGAGLPPRILCAQPPPPLTLFLAHCVPIPHCRHPESGLERFPKELKETDPTFPLFPVDGLDLGQLLQSPLAARDPAHLEI